ncbi:PAS domain S-box protein [Thermodesulfobium sp. 4217-1]|uniref:PAS domain-containing protein n=1 Tax=Thermodesulfobium sp. 4217-1 TaxID=3120013 RepID=UPI00322177F5
MKSNMLKLIEQDGEWYLHLLNLSPNCVEVIDLEGKLFFCNETHKSLFGYDTNSLVGRYWYELLPKEDRNRARDLFREIVNKGKRPHSIPMRGLKSNGEIINLWVRWNYLRLGDSSLFGIFAVITDISDLLLKKERILRNEQSMDLISSRTPCAFFSYNFKSKKFLASCKWKKLHNIEKGAKLDTFGSLNKCMGNEASKALIDFINSFEGEGIKEVRYSIESLKGKIELVSAAKAKVTKKSGITYLSGVTFQVEDDEALEERYKDSHADIMEKNPSAMFTFDPNSLKILDFNKTFLKITGFLSEEVKDKDLFELFPVESQKLIIISKEVCSSNSGSYSTHIRCKNSRIKDVSMNCSFHRDGKTKFVLCVLEDQTEKNLSIRKLFERERETNKFKESLQSLVNLECEKRLTDQRAQLIRSGYDALKFSTDFICDYMDLKISKLYQVIDKIESSIKDKDLSNELLSNLFKECKNSFGLIKENITRSKKLKSLKVDGPKDDIYNTIRNCTDIFIPIWDINKIKYNLSIGENFQSYSKDETILRDVILSIYSIITKNIIEASKQDENKNFEIRVLLTRSDNFVNVEFCDNAIVDYDSAKISKYIKDAISKNLQAASSLTLTYLNGILLHKKETDENILQLKIPIVVL